MITKEASIWIFWVFGHIVCCIGITALYKMLPSNNKLPYCFLISLFVFFPQWVLPPQAEFDPFALATCGVCLWKWLFQQIWCVGFWCADVGSVQPWWAAIRNTEPWGHTRRCEQKWLRISGCAGWVTYIDLAHVYFCVLLFSMSLTMLCPTVSVCEVEGLICFCSRSSSRNVEAICSWGMSF